MFYYDKESLNSSCYPVETNYLFFVAKSDFSGYHQFTDNFAEHEKYAKLYQQALNNWMHKDSLNKGLIH